MGRFNLLGMNDAQELNLALSQNVSDLVKGVTDGMGSIWAGGE